MGRRSTVPAYCPTGKRSYVDRRDAVIAGRRAQTLRGRPLDVYRCLTIYEPGNVRPGCGQYHLTTRDRKDDAP
jgi:hypothetical protein